MLQKALFDSEIEFFDENVPYTETNDPSKRSNRIRKYLHKILTHVILIILHAKNHCGTVIKNIYQRLRTGKNAPIYGWV